MIKTLRDVPVRGKRVLVRLDLDLPQTAKGFDTSRLNDGVPTVKFLLEHEALKVTVIAHMGRPEGKKVKKLSLKPIEAVLRKKFTKEENSRLVVMENLRYDTREEKGSEPLAKSLAKNQDLYVFDAFAVAHRSHTSVTHIPKLLPTVIGYQMEKELHALSPLLDKPKKPFVVILGGAKLETKLHLIPGLSSRADVVLIGGKLALEMQSHPVQNRKIIVATLTKTDKDISDDSVQQFKRFIAMAQTIVWNGPMGVFEEKASQEGTKQIAESVDRCTRCYTVIGGGDTEAAATKFKAETHVKHISSGGGALLEYLAYGKLEALEAIQQSQKKFAV